MPLMTTPGKVHYEEWAVEAEAIRAIMRKSECQMRVDYLCQIAARSDLGMTRDLIEMLEQRDYSQPITRSNEKPGPLD